MTEAHEANRSVGAEEARETSEAQGQPVQRVATSYPAPPASDPRRQHQDDPRRRRPPQEKQKPG